MGAVTKLIKAGLKKAKAAPGPKAKEGEEETFTKLLESGKHSKNAKPLIKRRLKNLKKRTAITEQSRVSSPTTLRKSIKEYERMLSKKEYGKGHIMTKEGIETRLSAHRAYLKKATGESK